MKLVRHSREGGNPCLLKAGSPPSRGRRIVFKRLIMFSLYYLFREMLAQKRRLLLTIFALAWATTAIACMLAIGEGLRVNFGNTMAASGKNLLIVFGGQTSRAYQGSSINQTINLTQQDFNNIQQALPNINITPEYMFNSPSQFGDQTNNLSISAVNPDYANLRNIQVQTGGRFIDELDNQNARRVMVIGVDLAKQIFGAVNPINKILLLSGQPFQVIGVTKPKAQLSSYMMPDNYMAFIPAHTYIALANPQIISDFVIVPNNTGDMAAIKQQVRQLIANAHQVDPTDPSIIYLQDTLKQQQATQRVFGGMQWFLGAVGVLTLIVAGVGIANVMFISVQRATREIGIRMAIGARTYHILSYYLVEALLTTAVGGMVGIILAKGIVYSLTLIPLNAPIFRWVGKPQPILSWELIFIVIGILSVIGFLSGFFPARKAANINPSEALRYE